MRERIIEKIKHKFHKYSLKKIGEIYGKKSKLGKASKN